FSTYNHTTDQLLLVGRPVPVTLLAPCLGCEAPPNAVQLAREREEFQELQRLNTQRTLATERKKSESIKRRLKEKDERNIREQLANRRRLDSFSQACIDDETTPSASSSSVPLNHSTTTSSTPTRTRAGKKQPNGAAAKAASKDKAIGSKGAATASAKGKGKGKAGKEMDVDADGDVDEYGLIPYMEESNGADEPADKST
ncbi:hypothetical protein K474DRAFT_1676883, partial [Panus rudis PR-1116 ss-1]